VCVKGSEIPKSNAINRDVEKPEAKDDKEEIEDMIVLNMSAADKSGLIEGISRDLEIQQLILIIDEGWPENVKPAMFQYMSYFTWIQLRMIIIYVQFY
jgi:hypothetical protein